MGPLLLKMVNEEMEEKIYESLRQRKLEDIFMKPEFLKVKEDTF